MHHAMARSHGDTHLLIGTVKEQRTGMQAAGVVVVGTDRVLVGELEPNQDATVVLPMAALHPGVQRLVPLHVYDMRYARDSSHALRRSRQPAGLLSCSRVVCHSYCQASVCNNLACMCCTCTVALVTKTQLETGGNEIRSLHRDDKVYDSVSNLETFVS